MKYGYETIIDLKGCSGINRKMLKEYVISLVKLIDMKRYGKCNVVYFGKGRFRGYSVMQFITTSSIVGHFTNKEAYINIFSCKKYSVDDVLEFTKNWFNSNKVIYKTIWR